MGGSPATSRTWDRSMSGAGRGASRITSASPASPLRLGIVFTVEMHLVVGFARIVQNEGDATPNAACPEPEPVGKRALTVHWRSAPRHRGCNYGKWFHWDSTPPLFSMT